MVRVQECFQILLLWNVKKRRGEETQSRKDDVTRLRLMGQMDDELIQTATLDGVIFLIILNRSFVRWLIPDVTNDLHPISHRAL